MEAGVGGVRRSAPVREVSTLQHSTRDMQSEGGIGHNHTQCGLLTFLNPTLLFLAPGVKLSGGGEGEVARVADDEERRGRKKKLKRRYSRIPAGDEL